MKWFKHLTGSLNNSIIFEAIEKFGSDGYLVFFGTLELMADEFDVHQPGEIVLSMKKLRKNLQLSRQKTVKILAFFNEKAKEKPKKKQSFFAEVDGDKVLLKCPRLRILTDEYTQKKIAKLSSQCRDNVGTMSGQSPVQEAEAEAEADLNKSTKPGAVLNQNYLKSDELAFASDKKIKERLSEISKDLHESKIFLNAQLFIGQMRKKNYNDRAILHALIRAKIKREFETTPNAYCARIIKIESGNYNERENARTKD